MCVVTKFTYYCINSNKYKIFKGLKSDYFTFLSDNKYISQLKINKCDKGLKEVHQHFKHPGLKIEQYDTILKKSTSYYFTLTKKNTDITIKDASLIDEYYNLSYDTYGTIKIANNLYVSGHCWFVETPDTELCQWMQLNELQFDVNKGFYVYQYEYENIKYKVEYSNLTLDNTKSLQDLLMNKLENEKIIKVDLTNHLNVEESLFMYILLQTKAYEESEDTWNTLEEEWSHKLKYDKELINLHMNKIDKDNNKIDE